MSLKKLLSLGIGELDDNGNRRAKIEQKIMTTNRAYRTIIRPIMMRQKLRHLQKRRRRPKNSKKKNNERNIETS